MSFDLARQENQLIQNILSGTSFFFSKNNEFFYCKQSDSPYQPIFFFYENIFFYLQINFRLSPF